MDSDPTVSHPAPVSRSRDFILDLRLPWRLVAVSVAVALLVACAALGFIVRSTHGQVAWSDGLAYFLYARSAVVDFDLDITDEFDTLDAQFPADSKAMEPLRKWSKRNADGTLWTPWPKGAGLIMTPFYAAGYLAEHIAASLTGRAANSYGLIPQCAFALGSTFFGVLGFWCLVLMCREIADERFAYLASLGAVLCGPVVFYVLFNPTMAHASSFGLIALLTLIWLRAWKYGTGMPKMLAMGLLLGVAATVRYQNALFGVLLVALVVKDWQREGTARVARFALAGLAACVLPVALLLRVQLQTSAGTTPGAVSAGQYPIDLTSPYFFDVLFSCRHGAFYWAPVLGAGVLGLLWAVRCNKGWAIALLVSLLAQVYLIGGLGLSSVAYAKPLPPGWLHHWDGAPSFGMRYLTECAPIFALGLAWMMQATRRHIPGSVWAAALLPFAAWNGLLILAYGLETITRSGCLPYADMLRGIAGALRIAY